METGVKNGPSRQQCGHNSVKCKSRCKHRCHNLHHHQAQHSHQRIHLYHKTMPLPNHHPQIVTLPSRKPQMQSSQMHHLSIKSAWWKLRVQRVTVEHPAHGVTDKMEDFPMDQEKVNGNLLVKMRVVLLMKVRSSIFSRITVKTHSNIIAFFSFLSQRLCFQLSNIWCSFRSIPLVVKVCH